MALPTLQPKSCHSTSTSKKKKIGVDSDVVKTFERCRQKNQRIQKHLKNAKDMSNFDLDKDIDKALKSLGKRYEKNLDKIIEQLGISEKRNLTPSNNNTAQSFQDQQSSFLTT